VLIRTIPVLTAQHPTERHQPAVETPAATMRRARAAWLAAFYTPRARVQRDAPPKKIKTHHQIAEEITEKLRLSFNQ